MLEYHQLPALCIHHQSSYKIIWLCSAGQRLPAEWQHKRKKCMRKRDYEHLKNDACSKINKIIFASHGTLTLD